MSAAGLVMFSRDPDYRAEFWSAKMLLITAVVLGALLGNIPLTRRLWRSAWTFEMTAETLRATHQFARTRHVIPWETIREVSKLRPAPLAGTARRQFSRIVLADGTELLFAPHLSRYVDFVAGLRARVRCPVFDPYLE